MCAHAVRVALEEMDGVRSATVSLNDGYAEIALEPDNAVSVAAVRAAIRNNGFTPREALVRVRGVVTFRGDVLTLTVGPPASASFRVDAPPDVMTELTGVANRSVTLTGVVPASTAETGDVALEVTEFRGR